MFAEDNFLTAAQGRSAVLHFFQHDTENPDQQTHSGTPQNRHSCKNDWEHPDQLSQASVSTNKAQWSLLSGTAIFLGWENSLDGCPSK